MWEQCQPYLQRCRRYIGSSSGALKPRIGGNCLPRQSPLIHASMNEFSLYEKTNGLAFQQNRQAYRVAIMKTLYLSTVVPDIKIIVPGRKFSNRRSSTDRLVHSHGSGRRKLIGGLGSSLELIECHTFDRGVKECTILIGFNLDFDVPRLRKHGHMRIRTSC